MAGTPNAKIELEKKVMLAPYFAVKKEVKKEVYVNFAFFAPLR